MWRSDPSPTNTPQTSSPKNGIICGKRGETLPIAPATSDSEAKKLKTDDISMTIEIDEFLECSVCLDFPASPIHSCANAHFLCGQCAPKFRACPTCKNPKLSPSPVCEKLAKEANKKIDCANLEAGCKEGILSTKFAHHLTSCYYREITCDYKSDFGAKVKFQEYAKHLEFAHKIKINIGPKITDCYLYDEKEHAKSGVFYKWGDTLIKFAGQDFFVNAQFSKESQLFISWVSLLGDKDLADKYICDVKFKNPKASNNLGCKWTLPVLAFHEIPSNECEAKLFKYLGGSAVASVSMAALRNWGVLEGDKILPIDVTYKIKDA